LWIELSFDALTVARALAIPTEQSYLKSILVALFVEPNSPRQAARLLKEDATNTEAPIEPPAPSGFFFWGPIMRLSP
jgi:hypothetical protein